MVEVCLLEQQHCRQLFQLHYQDSYNLQPFPIYRLWTTYKVLPKLTVGAGAQYRDQVYANTNPNTALTSTKILPAFTIYNAMVQYKVDENVDLQLNVAYTWSRYCAPAPTVSFGRTL
jgi:outer membrane receptor for monomeric catechols